MPDGGDSSERRWKWFCRVLIVMTFLFLGATVSWLVACLCTFKVDSRALSHAYVNADWPNEQVFIHRWFGGGRAHYWGNGQPPTNMNLVAGTFDDLPGWVDVRRLRSWYERHPRGWPARSHYYELAPDKQLVGGRKINMPARYFNGKPGDHGIIPVRPLWRGILINAVFYATLLWALWLAFGGTRKARRRKRGQCPGCGYDLRGAKHDVCPECGKAVAQPSRL